MHWRGKIRHIRRRFRRGKACRATPINVTVLSCYATANGVTRLNFQKIITLQFDVRWRWFLYKSKSTTFWFWAFSFDNVKMLKKIYNVSAPKWSCINARHIRKIIYFLYEFKWRYHLYESCTSHWDLQLYGFEFLYLRLLRCSRK
jgi:hypothetical protein